MDINSQLYSFSFMPYDWTQTHCGQAELQAYAEHTIDHFGIRDRFRFSTGVRGAAWNDDDGHYVLELDNGETTRFDVLITSVGLFNAPRELDWPGLREFEGTRLHSARWDTNADICGKVVALAGTGS